MFFSFFLDTLRYVCIHLNIVVRFLNTVATFIDFIYVRVRSYSLRYLGTFRHARSCLHVQILDYSTMCIKLLRFRTMVDVQKPASLGGVHSYCFMARSRIVLDTRELF